MTEVLNPRPPWRARRIVLGVTGGIAAYKSVQLARDLTRLGSEVDVVMTRGAKKFIQPLSFEGVTGRPVHGDMWRSRGAGSGAALHLSLAYEANAVCVAPATADLLARAAQGRADDLLTTVLLATRAPVLLCPAMNDRMFSHVQVQANLAHLSGTLGYVVAGPGVGPLAVGEGEGPGRMLEPEDIRERLGRLLGGSSLAGQTVLVTAGPTREALDPVRYLGNRSSGRMGYALARAAWLRGARVVLVSGPAELPDPTGVETVRVETAREMETCVRDRLPEADVAIFAAAVADYRPADVAGAKIKRSSQGDDWSVQLTANPDVAADTLAARKEGLFVVGFALESENLVAQAEKKLRAKAFDLIVANGIGQSVGFESETNQVTLISDDRAEELPLMPKEEVAERILDHISGARSSREEARTS